MSLLRQTLRRYLEVVNVDVNMLDRQCFNHIFLKSAFNALVSNMASNEAPIVVQLLNLRD